jgi:hypothetical protein
MGYRAGRLSRHQQDRLKGVGTGRVGRPEATAFRRRDASCRQLLRPDGAPGCHLRRLDRAAGARSP